MLGPSLTRNFGFSYRPHGNVADNEAFFWISADRRQYRPSSRFDFHENRLKLSKFGIWTYLAQCWAPPWPGIYVFHIGRMEMLTIMKRFSGFLPIGGSIDPAADSIFAKIVLNRKKNGLWTYLAQCWAPPWPAISVFHIGRMEMLTIMKRFFGFLPIGGSIDPAADSIFAKIVLNRKKMVFGRIWLNVGPLPDPQFRFFI